VAAESPEDADIQIVDEQIEKIPWDADVDVVGITCMTAVAPRAYEIARHFRGRGIPVVLGGMHPTLCPDEAIQHADAIVTGTVKAWQKVLQMSAVSWGIYRNEQQRSLPDLRPPRHLLSAQEYATINAVQATRGYPHGCDFCALLPQRTYPATTPVE
jgi:radical SAM superfamily enzyme YgiQ (UPF0313 family)